MGLCTTGQRALGVLDRFTAVCALYARVHSTITTASLRTVRVWDAVAGLCTKAFIDVTAAAITAMCFDFARAPSGIVSWVTQ